MVCLLSLRVVAFDTPYTNRPAQGYKILFVRKERPTHCRKCKGKIRELDKYKAEEARLDLKLAKKALKDRIRAKKEQLRN